MSLINDALKKASKPGESPTPPPGAIMQPAEAPAPDYGKLLLSVFVLIVLVLIAGTFFWWQGKKNSGLERAGASDSTTTNAQVAAQPQRSKAADHYLAPMEQAKAVSDKVSQQNREGEAMADSITASPKTTTATAQSVATPASACPSPHSTS